MHRDGNTGSEVFDDGRRVERAAAPGHPRTLPGFLRLWPAGLFWLTATLIALPALPQGDALTGDLAALRQQALDLVNAARQERGLMPLKLTDRLNQAAQKHAEDMLARGYYAHSSPEGNDLGDRYSALGGDSSRLLAENIARCSPCAGLPDAARVKDLFQGWMNSPEHRDNILRRGLTRFGFGIAAGKHGPLYAVQDFAGPGTTRGGDSRQAAEPLAPAEVGDSFARAANARREEAMVPPLDLSPVLSMLAAKLLPESAGEPLSLKTRGGLIDKLPADAREDWSGLSVLAGNCDGCGAEPTRGDLGFFLGLWLGDPGYSKRLLAQDTTAIGFALRAYGDGHKVAIAVLGQGR